MIKFRAKPLEIYSSEHILSILKFIGVKTKRTPHIKIALNFNLKTPPLQDSKAQLSFHLRDADAFPRQKKADFCIKNLTRWRVNLFQYDSFSDFLQKIKRDNYRSYRRALRAFEAYGATMSFIEGDWSQYADTIYQMYANVAKKHGSELYDLDFFRHVAKLENYKLLCVWHEGVLIGALVLIDEAPVFHSMVCAFDYVHTKKCRAYSCLHYEFLRLAFEAKKYTIADIGLTADNAKASMNFQPVSACMDITAKNPLLKGVLRLLARFTTSTINEEAKLQFKFQFIRKEPI